MLFAVVLGFVGWTWWGSLVPDTYSMDDMGVADFGGGEAVAHEAAHGGSAVGVDTLTGPPDGEPDVSETLVARAGKVEIGGDGARAVDGYTLNDTSPGPVIRAKQGDLVEVRLVNESVPDGVTLHWHGVDVPNAEDGVAGVTQDAVQEGEEHVYRFVAEDAGTYWYHSHQVSHEQVKRGLLGTLVVEPARGPATDDVVAAVHTYSGQRTVQGMVGEQQVEAAAGSTRRVRVINTNDGAVRTWVSGGPFRVLAIDGREVNEPTPVEGQTVSVPAGGRVDLEVEVPDDGVRVSFGGGASLVLGPAGADAPTDDEPKQRFDPLAYGSPVDVGFDPDAADRSFEYRIGRTIGFLDGRPGFWWTVNGSIFPDVPMYMVQEGDVVRMTISNDSGKVHPMHLHGHHAVVLSRDGEAASGSPWWVDSLDVRDGETFEVALVADNPGIWMDHCHNLIHASEGLVAHLAYVGVSTPFRVGGSDHNHPE